MPTSSFEPIVTKDPTGLVLDTRRTRPRFFDGKFLTAADLMQEQNYLLTRQADLALTLGFGVVNGLRVTSPGSTTTLRLAKGHGITPAGELVFLKSDLSVDLANVSQMQRLNAAFGLAQRPQAPFNTLSGLFVVGLRAVEFTANPVPVYPPSVAGSHAMRDGEIIEATAVTLVPFASDAAKLDDEGSKARVAREIFLDQKPPQLPASVLPLAMVRLQNGSIKWVDEWLVRREAGDDDRFGFGFAPRALAEAHFYHYRERIEDLPANGATVLAAKTYFEILPPAGPLPGTAINRADFTQGFFPPEARVELAVVPADELTALLAESMDLPPIDLSLTPEDNDAFALLVVAPVPRAAYGEVAARLAAFRPHLFSTALPRLVQQNPTLALRRLNITVASRASMLSRAAAITPTSAEADAKFSEAAWGELLAQTPQLWYVRRRNLPDSAALYSQPIRIAPVVTPGTPPTTTTPATPVPVPPAPPASGPGTPVVATPPPTTPATPPATTPTPPTSPPPAPPTGVVVIPTPPIATGPTPGPVTPPTVPVPPAGPVIPMPPGSPVITPPSGMVIVAPPTVTPTPTSPTIPTGPIVAPPSIPILTQPATPTPSPTTPTQPVVPHGPIIVGPITLPHSTILTGPAAPIATAPVGSPLHGIATHSVIRSLPRELVAPAADEEKALAGTLAEEGLWGRFVCLRAVADVPAHLALVGALSSELVLKNPVLQQGLIQALSVAAKLSPDNPADNFTQIQKSPAARALTADAVQAVTERLAKPETLTGLDAVFKSAPQVLKTRKTRAVLARADRMEVLAQLGLQFADSPELPKLATTIHTLAAADRAKDIAVAVDKLKKKLQP